MEIIREMLPADTFENIEMGAGMIAYKFDPENPGTLVPEDVAFATTGGVTVVCEPTYSDMENWPILGFGSLLSVIRSFFGAEMIMAKQSRCGATSP